MDGFFVAHALVSLHGILDGFKPIYQERVWGGGRSLESHLGRSLPEGGPIGESWEIVDRPEANSVVAEGRWLGARSAKCRRDWNA